MEALISAQNGLAVVVDGTSVLSIHADAPERDVPRQSHEVRWLLGGADDVIVLDEARREDVVERLQRERKRQLALMLLSCVLDSDPVVSVDIRQGAALELEELLQEPQVEEDLRNVLWSVSAPSSVDFAGPRQWLGPTVPRARTLMHELEERQGSIAEIRRAWDSLPKSLFENGPEAWKQQAIQLGLFRQMVELHHKFERWMSGKVSSADLSLGLLWPATGLMNSGIVGPRPQQWFRPLLYQEHRHRLPDYQQVLENWVASLDQEREPRRPLQTRYRSRPLASEVREPTVPYDSNPPKDDDTDENL